MNSKISTCWVCKMSSACASQLYDKHTVLIFWSQSVMLTHSAVTQTRQHLQFKIMLQKDYAPA